MFKADDYRLKIQAMRATLKEAEYALDIEHLRPRLAELEAEQQNPDVWQDLERSTKIGREIAGIRNKITAYEKGATALADADIPLVSLRLRVALTESLGLGVQSLQHLPVPFLIIQ